MDRLDAAGVPGGPVLTYEEALEDPHVQARGMIVDLEHPIIGPMKTIAPPTRSRISNSASDLPHRGSASTPHPFFPNWASTATNSTACSPKARCTTPTPNCRRTR